MKLNRLAVSCLLLFCLFASLSGIAAPDTSARIAETQAKLDDLLQRFTDKHPDVISLRQTLKELENRQQAEIEHPASRTQLALMRELHPCLNSDNLNLEETVPVDVVQSCPERNVEALVGVSRGDLFSVLGKPTGCRHADGSSEGWPWPDDHRCRDEIHVYYMFFPPCFVPPAGGAGPPTAILHISFDSAGVVTSTRLERPAEVVGIGRCVPSPTSNGATRRR
jgi:hypothetical protein